MEYRIKAIIPDNNLGSTPARVLRKSGIVFINTKIWNSLSPAAKKFILLHEEGHHVLDTSSELEADEYAFYRYAGSEKYSLKNTLKTITQTLDPDRPGHAKRIKNIINHILLFDYLQYGNEKALAMYQKLNPDPKLETFIKKQLVEFLKSKGIKSLSDLPVEQRTAILQEFLDTPAMIELMYRKTLKEALKNIEDTPESWHGRRRRLRELRRQLKEKKLEYRIQHMDEWKRQRKQKLSQLGQVAKPIIGTVAGIAGAALGVPAIGSVVNKVLGNQSQEQADTQTTQRQPQEQAPKPATKSETPSASAQSQDKSDANYRQKKDHTLLFVGIGGLIFVLFMLNFKRGF